MPDGFQWLQHGDDQKRYFNGSPLGKPRRRKPGRDVNHIPCGKEAPTYRMCADSSVDYPALTKRLAQKPSKNKWTGSLLASSSTQVLIAGLVAKDFNPFIASYRWV
ncbi:hypothetical protein PCANC_09180 [Puccinia coronata f. sp. avenae]|uniref:Uncharacterized protein n=1 Tax=Puccinia coronata f. sp. avenae TaxID=200324 RepID=A0A2N5VV55_9BASI|nr:hypothetical protein PCANC_09180 [Puccinia coronata f. sp. avenae]